MRVDALDRRRDGPLVVLADEDDRGVEHGRQVAGLVQDALVRRAVAEEADRHGVRALQPPAVGRADGDRGASPPTIASAPSMPVLDRRDVHAAALAPAVAVLAAR